MTDDLPPEVRAYKGRHSFADTKCDHALFFGREMEARLLVDVVAAERLSVLYARSGLGKTSLINARLLTALRASGYFPVVARLTQDKHGDPLQSIYSCIESEALRQEVFVEGGGRSTLWQYFSTAKFTHRTAQLRPVLILDQFEELFTIVREGSAGKFDALVAQLSDLVRGRMPLELLKAAVARVEALPDESPERAPLEEQIYGTGMPDIKVLLSFREDFLPEMEALQDRMPGIFRNVVRIQPLSRADAESAIVEPARAWEVLGTENTFTVEAEALAQLLDFLGTQIKGKREITGGQIEPVHLQLLCDELDRRRQFKKTGDTRVITVADLGGIKGMTRILERYYQGVLKRFPILAFGWNSRRWRPSTTNFLVLHCPRRAIRKLCQGGLITPSRRRNIIMADDIRSTFGVDDKTLFLLVNERLLRCEPRLGSEFYELAHDSLVAPIVTARTRSLMWSGVFLAAVLLPLALAPTAALLARNLQERSAVEAKMLDQQQQTARREAERTARLAVLSASAAPDRSRDEAFAALLESRFPITGAQLRSVNYSGVIDGVDFSLANLSGSVLDRSTLRNVKFTGANLSNASLASTRNFDVSFEGAELDAANLRQADLRNVVLRNADLTETVFAGADLAEARVDGVRNALKAKFSDAEWWLARGWSADLLQALESKWPHRDIVNSKYYRDAVSNRQFRVQRASSDIQRSRDLNDLAWYRAIRGVDLHAAFKEASQAVAIQQPLEEGGISKTPALDTLAYIQLQLGDVKGALRTFSKVNWESASDPEVFYHYGLVLERSGDAAQAQRMFDRAKVMGHEPTHERLLVKPMKR